MDVVEGRPVPTPSPLTEGFWAAAREHRLVIQRCDQCEAYRHYPQPVCPECLSDRWTWTEISGRGVIYTFTVTHQPFHQAWKERTPFAVATIELTEGVRMVSDLPADDVDRVAIGHPVEVFFEDHEIDGTPFTFPRFRLGNDG